MQSSIITQQQDPVVRAILEQTYLRTDKYAKTFYPNRFNLPFNHILHAPIFEVIDAVNPDGTPKYQKIAIKAPRGVGKSSIAKTVAAKRMRFQACRYLVYIGKTFDFASQQTENIKNGMLQNKIENKIFGNIKISAGDADFSATFSKKSWMTSYGNIVFPRGVNQPVRGLLFDYEGFSYRPDLIIVDDLEDKKEILNDTFRAELEEWFFADVVKSVPLEGVSRNWQIIYIDTLKHSDSLLQKLIDNPEWKTVELSICDDEFKSYAPEFMSDEAIQNELREAELNPLLLDVFYQERMGKPISEKNRTFKPEFFKRYTETSPEFRREMINGEIQTVVLHDPAKEVNPSNADTAIATIGVNVRRRKIYIRDIVADKLHPEAQYKTGADKIEQYNAILLGVEENSLHEFIAYPFKEYLNQRDIEVEWMNLKPRRGSSKGTGKIEKIGGLISFYEVGMIYHNVDLPAHPEKPHQDILEGQLLDYPRGKRVDVADVVSYIIQVLNEFFVYFDTLGPDMLEARLEEQALSEEEHYYETAEELPNDWATMK